MERFSTGGGFNGSGKKSKKNSPGGLYNIRPNPIQSSNLSQTNLALPVPLSPTTNQLPESPVGKGISTVFQNIQAHPSSGLQSIAHSFDSEERRH